VRKVPIRIIFGLDPNDWRRHHDAVIALLDSICVKDPAVAGHYTLTTKDREFDVVVSYTKASFKTALDTDGAIVVYAGHSRLGQGPAFGTSVADTPECPDAAAFPDNPWESHFRMGYDVVDIPCIDEIIHHGTNPVEFPGTTPLAKLFVHDQVRAILTRAKGRSTRCDSTGPAKRALLTCFPTVADQDNCRGLKSLKNRHYWKARKKNTEFDTLVTAGASDLDGVSLRCAVLLMYSCTAKHHYRDALMRRRKAAKSKCLFYLTSAVPSGIPGTKRFVELVLSGVDPVTKKGKQKLLRELGSIPHSGRIVVRP